MSERRILLVAGGTGGHIMPAISFGRWAIENRAAEVDYVCGVRPLEKEIYTNSDISPHIIGMTGSPLSGGISVKARMERSITSVRALDEARRVIRKFSPSCCVLFGGYISLPFLLVCKMLRIPVVIHEQNACAGQVTKLAAKARIPVLTGWETCFPLSSKQFKRVGVPVRRFSKPDRAGAMKQLGVTEESTNKFIAVIFSGSLGSTSIKKQILSVSGDEKFGDFLFLIPSVSTEVEKVTDRVWLLPKIWDPSPLFAVADCAVTRAGGSMLAELAVLGIPALIIPWRDAAADHQYYNASAFISENTGIILNSENDPTFLATEILELRKLTSGCKQNRDSKLYNNANKICEQLWDAIASQC